MMTTLRLASITIVGTLAYLGLAILGWGGFAAFFSHPALIALTIALFALSGVALFSGGNLSPGVREDRANRWVIVAFGLIGVLAAYLPAYTDRKGFWTLDGDAIRWLGVVLFAAGGALRTWPVFVLGRRFSGCGAIQPGHSLVTGGVYGIIRHPSYLGLLVNSLGWALAFRSGVGVLLTVLLIPPHILWDFPLKSHSADDTQADPQAIRFSSIEVARRLVMPPSTTARRQSCSRRHGRRATQNRCFDLVDDLLGHGIMEHVSNTRNQPQRALRDLLMNPDRVFAMIDDADVCACHDHDRHGQLPIAALHRGH